MKDPTQFIDIDFTRNFRSRQHRDRYKSSMAEMAPGKLEFEDCLMLQGERIRKPGEKDDTADAAEGGADSGDGTLRQNMTLSI